MTYFSGFDEAVVVDVETTGLDSKRDRIVSVAMIRANFADLRKNSEGPSGETMDVVVNPQCRIPKEASRVHGITDKDVRDKGPFSEVGQELRVFIGDRPIIGHNVSFDKRFLSAEFKRSGVKTLARNKSFCTMLRFQELNDGRRWGSNLDNVVKVMGVEGRRSTKHDAIEDALMAFQVACIFYMMDNGIRVPGGKPASPARKGQYNGSGSVERQERHDSKTGFGATILTFFVILVLAWLFS